MSENENACKDTGISVTTFLLGLVLMFFVGCCGGCRFTLVLKDMPETQKRLEDKPQLMKKADEE